jgi:hypothetical protein
MNTPSKSSFQQLLSPYGDADVQWVDDLTLRCGDIDLRLTRGFDVELSSDRTITLFKHPQFVRSYLELLSDVRVENMIEVGIWDGGSAVFFWNLLKPAKLCCIELKDSAPHLSRYIGKQQIGDSFPVYFGVDQSNKTRIGEILAREFECKTLDLVIDDASHLYSPSRATFEAIFPRLRSGGLYVLEDWKTNLLLPYHGGDDKPDHPPFHQLVHEILDLSMRFPGVIPTVKCFHNFVVVERGPATLDAGSFDVLDHGSLPA